MAVASFPQRTDEFPETLTAAGFGPSRYTANYSTAAAAFRRSVYLEWRDGRRSSSMRTMSRIIRCNAWRRVTRSYYYTGIVIRHHFTSLKRNEIRTHHRHARNEQWSIWRRCPFPDVLALSPYRALSQLNYARKRGMAWVMREPAWWMMALRGLPAALRKRRPVPARRVQAMAAVDPASDGDDEEWEKAFGGKAEAK